MVDGANRRGAFNGPVKVIARDGPMSNFRLREGYEARLQHSLEVRPGATMIVDGGVAIRARPLLHDLSSFLGAGVIW